MWLVDWKSNSGTFCGGGLADEVKLLLVNWKNVCQSNQLGGLGIKRFTSFNTTLLGKWLWRFAMELNAFWRTVIANKYGIDKGGWCSGVSNESYGVPLWKFIRGSWGRFSQSTRFVVGRGLRICFWDDLWCG